MSAKNRTGNGNEVREIGGAVIFVGWSVVCGIGGFLGFPSKFKGMQQRNDCKINAAKRLLPAVRGMLPEGQ